MGENKLDRIMKDKTQAASISGKTNHSGRKTGSRTVGQWSFSSDYPDNGPQKLTVSQQLCFSSRN